MILPLLKPGLLAAWFWVMVHAYRELTIALMLARSQNRTAAVVIYDLWEEGSFLLLSAFGVLMFLAAHRSLDRPSISRRFGVQEQYCRVSRPCRHAPSPLRGELKGSTPIRAIDELPTFPQARRVRSHAECADA